MTSAQFALYPLGVAHLGPILEEAIAAAQATGVTVEVGAMASVLQGEEDQVFDALRAAWHAAAGHGATVLVISVSNACPVSSPSTG